MNYNSTIEIHEFLIISKSDSDCNMRGYEIKFMYFSHERWIIFANVDQYLQTQTQYFLEKDVVHVADERKYATLLKNI
jgi:hypothetical protein